MADEGIEVFPAVALEAAFDGPQMVRVQPVLALAVERHEDEVADHVGAAEIAAAGVHGLEDAVRVGARVRRPPGGPLRILPPRRRPTSRSAGTEVRPEPPADHPSGDRHRAPEGHAGFA